MVVDVVVVVVVVNGDVLERERIAHVSRSNLETVIPPIQREPAVARSVAHSWTGCSRTIRSTVAMSSVSGAPLRT